MENSLFRINVSYRCPWWYINRANTMMKTSWKEGVRMNGFTYKIFYELTYQNKHFSLMEFIRMDVICKVSYITLKDVVTGETLTFEESEIQRLRVIGEQQASAS